MSGRRAPAGIFIVNEQTQGAAWPCYLGRSWRNAQPGPSLPLLNFSSAGKGMLCKLSFRAPQVRPCTSAARRAAGRLQARGAVPKPPRSAARAARAAPLAEVSS